MRHRVVAITLSLAAASVSVLGGCAGDLSGIDDGNDGDDGSDVGPDAILCRLNILFDPPEPIVGMHPQLRAIADSDVIGTVNYSWEVLYGGHAVDFEPAEPGDLRSIRFDIPDPGVYTVRVFDGCAQETRTIQVSTPQADFLDLRMRVTPPASLQVPPVDKIQRVYGNGGQDVLVTVFLDAGTTAPARVVDAAMTGVPAYLRFSPVTTPDAAVEAFSGADGRASPKLLSVPHDVVIVPVEQTFAPVRISNWNPLGAQNLVVGPGTAITGTVRAPDGSGMSNATVQLTIDGVPSTYATTAGNGSFTVRASDLTGLVTVAVTPPAGAGLPRVSAQSSTFDLTQPVTVSYLGTLTTRDVGGTTVTRGAPLASTRVVLAGTFDAGTVQAGTTSVIAKGTTRIALTTTAAGALPAALAPAKPLSAVVMAAPDDTALVPFDLTGGVPATVTAPAMVAFSTTVTTATAMAGNGVELEAVPIENLAIAGAPSVHAKASATGVVTGELAAGGRYQLRFRDPMGRGAARLVDVNAAAVAPTYQLRPALTLRGTLISPAPSPLDRAVIQIMCGDCTGLDRDRPIAETTSTNGAFTVAVPDPDDPGRRVMQ